MQGEFGERKMTASKDFWTTLIIGLSLLMSFSLGFCELTPVNQEPLLERGRAGG